MLFQRAVRYPFVLLLTSGVLLAVEAPMTRLPVWFCREKRALPASRSDQQPIPNRP